MAGPLQRSPLAQGARLLITSRVHRGPIHVVTLFGATTQILGRALGPGWILSLKMAVD
jgi:hypothetical protein